MCYVESWCEIECVDSLFVCVWVIVLCMLVVVSVLSGWLVVSFFSLLSLCVYVCSVCFDSCLMCFRFDR